MVLATATERRPPVTRTRTPRGHKDGRAENPHPLNRGRLQDRIPLFESYLRFAEALAEMPTYYVMDLGDSMPEAVAAAVVDLRASFHAAAVSDGLSSEARAAAELSMLAAGGFGGGDRS